MLAARLIRQLKAVRAVRHFSYNAVDSQNKKTYLDTNTVKPNPKASNESNASIVEEEMHRVTEADRDMFVLVKLYPNVNRVPHKVPKSMIREVKWRIFYGMCVCALAVVGVAFVAALIFDDPDKDNEQKRLIHQSFISRFKS